MDARRCHINQNIYLRLDNRGNQVPKQYSCQRCKCIDKLTGNFISLITLSDFLSTPSFYIENAYEKAYKNIDNYEINKGF